MKKVKVLILMLLLVTSIIFMVATSVKAETTDDFNLIEEVKITSAAGSYQTGQKVNFVVTFEKEAPTGLDMESFVIKFSESADKTITSGIANGKTITYQYTIESTDKGTIRAYDFTARKGTEVYSSTADFEGTVITVNASTQQGGTQGDATWSDGSKIKMSLSKVASSGNYYNIKLNLSGLELNRNYYIFVTNGATTPTLTTSTTGHIENATFSISNNTATETQFTLKNEIPEKNGDIYVWIYEEKRDDTEGKYINQCIVKGTKLQRPAQHKLGSRMVCYFFSDFTSSYVYEPVQNVENRKINLKIGTITDNSILKSIKNGESNCLSKLLQYAKNAKSPIYTGSITAGSQKQKSITTNMNLVDKQYYYVYMTLEDGNGNYYPVEDVSLYQALVDPKVGKNLFDYLDSNFKWNLADGEPSKPNVNTNQPTNKDDTIANGKLPQTGVNTIVIISMIGVAVVAAVVGLRQYKKYNIKY